MKANSITVILMMFVVSVTTFENERQRARHSSAAVSSHAYPALKTEKRISIGTTCGLARLAAPALSLAEQTMILQPSAPAYHDQRG